MFTDPLAQELLIGATIATALILLGVLIGFVLAADRRAAERDDR